MVSPVHGASKSIDKAMDKHQPKTTWRSRWSTGRVSAIYYQEKDFAEATALAYHKRRSDFWSTTRYNTIGECSIHIRTTSNEKKKLACMADGSKLPPCVFYKWKNPPQWATFTSAAVVRFQSRGWMDDMLCLDWVKTVWGRRPGGTVKKDWSLLVLDAFRCHRNKSMLEKPKRDHKTEVAITLGGMTSLLQPLDVSINKLIEVLLWANWGEWIHLGEKPLTKGGRMRCPDMATIIQWIVDCWAELDPAIVKKAFLKCCISNVLDCSEDKVLWDESAGGRRGQCRGHW